MKKTLSILLALVIALSCSFALAYAQTETADVFVTISDKDGKLALAQEKITVSDQDGDGKLTINDALFAAHEAKYEGGAEAGYGSISDPNYGLSLAKLWGAENAGFGYYVNNAAAWNLADEVKSGDFITAFVYTDLVSWSDAYSWFDKNTASMKLGNTLELTLSAIGFDEQYNTLTLPVENAFITLNGEKTEFKTDKDGKVTIDVKKAGTYTVSAVSDSQILVSPVCKLTVTETQSPNTGDNNSVLIGIIIMSACALTVFGISKRKFYEK